MMQEMMGFCWDGSGWHQLDHMQTICTSLQTDNHITQFLQAGCSSWRPTKSVRALNAIAEKVKKKLQIKLISEN